MIVTFTLQNQYSGATYVAGPFNISGTTDANVTTELATGITKAQLLTGHTITGISDSTTGGTIASTGICTNTQQWEAFPSQPTPTPTTTSTAEGGTCWTFTYSTFNQPTGVSVRWTNVSNGATETMLITDLESIDNGDNTITAYICVKNTGAYATPVCVQSGIEVTCPGLGWTNTGCSCTNNSTCALGCE